MYQKLIKHEPLVATPIRFASLDPTEATIDYLIEGFLPKGYLCFLGGKPKVGKTCFASAIALSVASGVPFLGRAISERRSVLYLALDENGHERAQSVCFCSREIRERMSEDGAPVVHQVYSCMPIDHEWGVSDIGVFAHTNNCGLVIVDPLHAATSGFSLYDGHAARRALEGLKNICRRSGLTVLVLHDLKPSTLTKRFAESPQLASIPGLLMILESEPPPRSAKRNGEGVGGGANRSFVLRCQGRGRFANRTWHLLSNDPLHYEPYVPARTEGPNPDPTPHAIVDALRDGPLFIDDIVLKTGLNENTLRNNITKLNKEGTIKVCALQNRRHKYCLTKKEERESREWRESSSGSDDDATQVPVESA